MVRKLAFVSVAVMAFGPAVAAQGVRASEHDHLVAKHAAAYGVPESLVRRVIHIESKGNPRVVSKGNYGLMQIRLGTAKAMGYTGGAEGLLDADTNMTYAVRYLAGAYRAAGGNQEQAIRNYQRGYYDKAKAQGFSPYAAPATTLPQAAAPDPSLVQEADDRRKAADLQRQAALDSRVEQKRVAEDERRAQRRAALQAAEDQRKAAEQSRNAEREARQQERAARQAALKQKQIEQRQAIEQKRVEQREAALQQRMERERARTQPRAEPERQSAAPPSEQPRQTSARRAEQTPNYAWYNPMRFFKHPAHNANNPATRER